MAGPSGVSGGGNDVPAFPQVYYASTSGSFGIGNNQQMSVALPDTPCAFQVDLVDIAPISPVLQAPPNGYTNHVLAAIVSPNPGANTAGCGVIKVTKQTSPSGSTTSFPFTGDLSGSIMDGQSILKAEPFPGTYTTTEQVPSGWSLTSIACDSGGSGNTGTATATYSLTGSQLINCTYTDTQQQQPPPSQGEITPTNVECSDFLAGTPALGQINYPAERAGTIGQGINPGVFFYWTKITTTMANQTVTVSQSNTSTNNAALFGVHQGWDRLYTGNCSSWTAGTVIGANGSGASFTVPTPGNYVIGVKYSTKTIAGTAVPVPANITYNFTTSLGPVTSASVPLVKQ
jgi:hypothetical protein